MSIAKTFLEKFKVDEAIPGLQQYNKKISDLKSKISALNDKASKLREKNRNETNNSAYEKREGEISKLMAEAGKLRKEIEGISAKKRKLRKNNESVNKADESAIGMTGIGKVRAMLTKQVDEYCSALDPSSDKSSNQFFIRDFIKYLNDRHF